ncbi:MAG: hypothetical protein RLZZ175_902 [Bacteroidota bacterium]|jgi:polyisoprenoid-binding protein YceI
MKKILISAVALFASAMSYAQDWSFDKSHSSVKFSVTHMMVSETAGQFRKFEGSVKPTSADFQNALIDFTIDVNSIDTDVDQRDAHLKSADFFDAAKYPKITFKSKSFTKVDGKKYKLTGDLTMHGVTKTVTLDVVYNGTIKDPYGFNRAGFKITGTINRYDFGLKYNAAIEAGGTVISEEVEIVCAVEFTKK